MGSFYNNLTLIGVQVEAVERVFPGPGLVASDGDAVVVFADADAAGTESLGQRLSSDLGCVSVGVLVHDDDILYVSVYKDGGDVGRLAVPDPAAYWGLESDSLEGLTMDAAGLVDAVGRGDVERVHDALVGDFVFATERHEALIEGLSLPRAAVGWGYHYLTSEPDAYDGPPLTELRGV